MGAWGVAPTENDGALDWLGEHVHQALAGRIKDTLEAFLEETGDAEEDEAEAAAALLVDTTVDPEHHRFRTLDLRYDAKIGGLWDLAMRAVDKMIADDWPANWNVPEDKLAALNELRSELERVRQAGAELPT